MNAEFMEALGTLEKEKGISKEILIEALENALVAAYKSNFGKDTVTGGARVDVDRETGAVHLYISKTVVTDVEHPMAEISIEDARRINPLYYEGDVIEEEIKPRNFGRIAAQTAKQVILQRIKEAERGKIFEEYSEKECEVLTGIVQRVDRTGIYMDLSHTEGFMDMAETIRGEEYEPSMRLKVYLLKVNRTTKGAQVIVSRKHPGLVKRLFELEVPEIQSGIVQIRGLAREAGSRTKVAVYSTDPKIDAVGSCVGPKGIRVERIVNELRTEKIDIIEWDQDPVMFIAKALSPAKVTMVYINEEQKAARVIVPDDQFLLAIGKEGQNVRLAVKLTGWKIDIRSQSQINDEIFSEEDIQASDPHEEME
ncbi:MAG: transcription termination/antitermination protein NusA [Clostridia bacterium]|nr:transcription termination/antitermination protein NusA [Clostridia bacterium]